MAVKSKEQINQRNASTDKGFGNVSKQPTSAGEGCDGQGPVGDHHNSAAAPNIPEGQTESAMILQAANAGFETITRIDSIMSQATAKVAAASEQLAIQAADQDAFVLGGGHYLTTYFNRLNAHQAANQAYQDELDFQTRINQAMAQRAQLPQAKRVLAELNLLPGAKP
jgi:hypothetical protein